MTDKGLKDMLHRVLQDIYRTVGGLLKGKTEKDVKVKVISVLLEILAEELRELEKH